ncbi:MAG: large-conductance mechanosensitive channel protein MscL [Erysipelotrichaceae bacterium]|jgi:large conductance mechanosensitive channel|nr:large-conductance mechanosensitive channel protein MscL [Erysipelotrichaceae bacterium]
MKKFISEFKEFISRGNVLDLAVGMVMGSAFTAIVGSLVNDIIMPVVGTIIGGINFSNLKVVITPASGDVAEAAITYGNFIQAIVNFLIIAFVIFSVIKGINKLKKQKEEEPAEEPAPEEPSEEILLLREIRDSLKEK